MNQKLWMLAFVLLLIAGCGADGSGNAGAAGASADEIGQGLSLGDFELEMVGHVRTVGPYSGDREPAEFAPSNYGQTRERRDGTGGRELVVANNMDGPFSLRLRADLQRGDDEPDRELGAVFIQLPPGAEAGRTYPLETSPRARHGEAFVALMGYGQPLSFGGSGTVSVAELGDHLSLQFEFHGGNAEDDNERYIIGRAYRIPLSLRGEARYTLSINGTEEDHIEMTRFRNIRSIMVGQSMQINFDGEPRPGVFALGNRAAGDVVGIDLFEHRSADFGGQIELNQDGDIWSATFEFEGSGETIIRGSGGFEHVRAFPR